MLTLALTGLCVGAVVTERRRVEKALEQSEFNLSRAQSVAKVGSWNLDIRTDEFLWSRRNIPDIPDFSGTPDDVQLAPEDVRPHRGRSVSQGIGSLEGLGQI